MQVKLNFHSMAEARVIADAILKLGQIYQDESDRFRGSAAEIVGGRHIGGTVTQAPIAGPQEAAEPGKSPKPEAEKAAKVKPETEKPAKQKPAASTPPEAASSHTTAADQPGAAATPTAPTSASTDDVAPLDYEQDVMPAFLALVKAKGRVAGRSVLTHFKPDAAEGARLREVVTADQYPAVLAKINELKGA